MSIKTALNVLFGPQDSTGRLLQRMATLMMSVSIAWAFFVAVNTAHSADSGRGPNVVLILADDMGWNDYSFMGHPQIRTPRLDRFAAQSLVYTRGYVTVPLCSPALASVMTGLYAHEHKITGNDPSKPQPRSVLFDQIERMPRLPALLGEAGYVSLQTGKWWFEHYRRGGFTNGMTVSGRHGEQGLVIGRESMEPVLSFVRAAQREKQPFFVWYAPMLPHTPHNPPQRLLQSYLDKGLVGNEAKYAAMCEWFDETCGQLLDFLDEQKLADNTIVLYITDNGYTVNTTGAPGARGGARGKLTPYEKGIRTPVMIRWGNKIAPRRDDTTLVSGIDIAPTILKACGLNVPAVMTGINLLDSAALNKRTAVFSEHFTHDLADITQPAESLVARVCIDGEWKLIAWQDGRNELFHLAVDPTEQHDLAQQQPERVNALRAKLTAHWDLK